MRVLWAAITLIGVLLASNWVRETKLTSGGEIPINAALEFSGNLVSINVLTNKIVIEEEIAME